MRSTFFGIFSRVMASDNALYVQNYPSVQAAFDALEASTTARKLVFPSDGVYTITEALLLENCTDKIVVGNNAQLTFTGVTFGIKFWNNTRSAISGLKLIGPALGTTYGIHINGADRCYIDSLTCTGWTDGIHYAGAGSVDIGFCTSYENATGVTMNGEYGTLHNCVLNSNTSNGVKVTNGNNKILGNFINYNVVGVLVDSVAGGNADHGLIQGNSINHNTACGVYLKDLVYSMDVVGNEIWATNGANLGSAPKNSSFGVYVLNGTGVKIANNSISRNKFSVGIEGINKSGILGNTFLTDTAETTYHVREVGGTNTTYLIDGNMFDNGLTGGHTVVLATDCPGATLGTNIIV